MSTIRNIAVLVIVVGVLAGGALIVARTGRPEGAARWLRAQLHLGAAAGGSRGTAHVAVSESQDRVFAVARDPSTWVRSLTHLDRDPGADITTTGTPGQVDYVYAWSSDASDVTYPRGSVTLTTLEPPGVVGLHLALEGDPAEVTLRLGAGGLDVSVTLAPHGQAALTAIAIADGIAEAVQDAVTPRVAAPRPASDVVAPHREAAAPRDLGVAQRPTVSWNVQACKNAPGCLQNGFARTCGEAGMKSVRITVTDERTQKKVVTRTSCPTGATQGDIAIDVPPGNGPFSLSASSDDVSTARSEIVCHITPRCWAHGISLNLYALGCNDPECQACMDVGHAPGWCE